MKAEVNGKTVEFEPNSKPILLKRLIADGFDIAVLFGLFLLLTALFMKTPLAAVYEQHFTRYREIEKETAEMYPDDAKAISEALGKNAEYRDERFAANLHSYLVKALACLIAEVLLFLLVPLVSRDRATAGKLLTRLLVFNETRQTRARWYQAVYRFVFVLLIDSLALYLFTGILTFLLVPVLRLVELLLSRKNKTLCDLITGTMIIEKLSYDGLN